MYTRVFILALYSFLIMLSACSEQTGRGNESTSQPSNTTADRPDYVLVIHGGAGTIRKDLIGEEKERQIRNALDSALDIGSAILDEGGTSLDAVEQTIRFLEDSPHFNAGRGSVFTNEGTNEMDAAIMDGSSLQAGAVTGLGKTRHPISAARKVMENSKHVFLSGSGAETFAAEQGLEMVDPSYFFTPHRYESLQKALEKEVNKMGTVGAVALDRHGNLASATSTGGMTNKRYGRIGDVPVIGAGTYANNSTCAVSCTGHGEFFIRYTVAHDLSAMMEYAKMGLQEAAEEIVQGKLLKAGGSGGLIAVDHQGNFTMEFNSAGMYRGVVMPGKKQIGLYRDELGSN